MSFWCRFRLPTSAAPNNVLRWLFRWIPSTLSGRTVLLAAIILQIPTVLSADEIVIPPADLLAAGLPKPSIIRTSKLVSIHQGLIRKRLGCVSGPALQRVLLQIQSMFQTE